LQEIGGTSQHQKCATYQCIHDDVIEVYLVTQKIIMKTVRLYPTLKWLRSDLTAEHVAFLQQEIPGITFVTKQMVMSVFYFSSQIYLKIYLKVK
jgi:hypothetical protein